MGTPSALLALVGQQGTPQEDIILQQGMERRVRKAAPPAPEIDAFTSSIESAKTVIMLRALQQQLKSDPNIAAFRKRLPNLGGLEGYAANPVLNVMAQQAEPAPDVSAAFAYWNTGITNALNQYVRAQQGARSISDADIVMAKRIFPSLQYSGVQDAQFQQLIAPLQNELDISAELLSTSQIQQLENMLFGTERQRITQEFLDSFMPQGEASVSATSLEQPPLATTPPATGPAAPAPAPVPTPPTINPFGSWRPRQ